MVGVFFSQTAQTFGRDAEVRSDVVARNPLHENRVAVGKFQVSFEGGFAHYGKQTVLGNDEGILGDDSEISFKFGYFEVHFFHFCGFYLQNFAIFETFNVELGGRLRQI